MTVHRARLATLVLLGAAGLWILRNPELATTLRAMLDTLSLPVAAGLFLAAFSLGTVLLMPASLFMLLAGAYFGLGWGVALSVAGFTSGATLAFLVSRHVARDLVLHVLPGGVRDRMTSVHEHGWKLVAVLRLTGLIPSIAINYALGLTPLPLRTFVWASAAFALPSCVILTYAGMAGDIFINGGGLRRLLVAATLMALLAIAGWVLRKRLVPGSGG